jgi:TusA-related sulfurtransferase
MLRNSATWLLPFLLVTILFLSCRSDKKNEYRLITVKGKATMQNWSRSLLSTAFRSDSGNMNTMPAKNGDILYFRTENIEIFTKCNEALPDTIQLREKDTLLYLNEKLFGLLIDTSRDMMPWFKQMSLTEMKSLQSITISSFIPNSYLEYLDAIAKVNPEIDLLILSNDEPSNNNIVNWISQRFRPEFLHVSMSNKEIGVLKNFTTVKILSIELTDSINTEVIPALPGVSEFTLMLSDQIRVLTPDFFKLNPQLTSLSIYSDIDITKINWQPLQKLETLRIYAIDSSIKFPKSEFSPRLNTLLLSGNTDFPYENLLHFKHLKELGLPSSVPQDVFNKVIRNQPDLEYLHIIGNDTLLINDYSILERLKKLRFMVITGQSGQVNTIFPLKGLKFLSLPKDFFEDSLQVVALKKALPDTVITPNQGFCMGSGWLLLLLPLMAIGIFTGKKYFSKAD